MRQSQGDLGTQLKKTEPTRNGLCDHLVPGSLITPSEGRRPGVETCHVLRTLFNANSRWVAFTSRVQLLQLCKNQFWLSGDWFTCGGRDKSISREDILQRRLQIKSDLFMLSRSRPEQARGLTELDFREFTCGLHLP